MKIIVAIALIYPSVALLFIVALCKAAARRTPQPPQENKTTLAPAEGKTECDVTLPYA